MTRSLRRWISLACLAGFAFAQLALAAYACPLGAPGPQSAVVASSGPATDSCPGHAESAFPETGAVCQAHCGAQTGVTGGGTVVVPPLVLAPFPVVVPLDANPTVTSFVARLPDGADAAAPPATERFCRLLI